MTNTTNQIQVGKEFIWRKKYTCKILAVKEGKVKFTVDTPVPMSGSMDLTEFQKKVL